MKKLLASIVVGSGFVAAAAGAGLAGPAAPPLAAHQEPVLGRLYAPGDRVDLGYRVDTAGVKAPTGTLYARSDLDRSFQRVRLALRRGVLHSLVPARLLRGSRLFYYAVVRDPKTGRSATLPAAGARRPESAWVLRRPVLVRLGAHRFGHTRAPEAVVARAAASEVGWQMEDDVFGPETFLVGPDRSVWLDDELNSRLLVWRSGHPDAVARSVPLPTGSTDSDFALGPGGSVYVTLAVGRGTSYHRELARLGPTGNVLWQSVLADPFGGLATNVALRVGPDGALYAVLGRPGSAAGDRGWMPVATPAGRPLATAAQLRRNLWPYQPLPTGLRLLAEVYTARPDSAPREARFGLVDSRGRLVRSWRVFSRTDINFNYATPELVGGDPVVVLDATAGSGPRFKWEYEVLRLGRRGIRASFALPRAVYGDNILADIRVDPGDGKLYQLSSSPTTGVVISRYSLGAAR